MHENWMNIFNICHIYSWYHVKSFYSVNKLMKYATENKIISNQISVYLNFNVVINDWIVFDFACMWYSISYSMFSYFSSLFMNLNVIVMKISLYGCYGLVWQFSCDWNNHYFSCHILLNQNFCFLDHNLSENSNIWT